MLTCTKMGVVRPGLHWPFCCGQDLSAEHDCLGNKICKKGISGLISSGQPADIEIAKLPPAGWAAQPEEPEETVRELRREEARGSSFAPRTK